MSWLDDLKERFNNRPKTNFSADNAKRNISNLYQGSNLQYGMNQGGIGNMFKNLNNNVMDSLRQSAGNGYPMTPMGLVQQKMPPPKSQPKTAAPNFNTGANVNNLVQQLIKQQQQAIAKKKMQGGLGGAGAGAGLGAGLGSFAGGGGGGESYPQFGKSLSDYLKGTGGENINTNFGKKLQDYLSMAQYSPEVWAKDLLAAHDQYNDKMGHRGKIGSESLGLIYSQLGDQLGGLKDESVGGYQTAIDDTTARNESAQGARQDAYENQRMSDDARRKLLLGEDAVTGVSDAQANVDSQFGQDTQSNTARGNSIVDNLTSRQQTAGDKFGQIQGAAGFRGREAQQALMADVNDAISKNETSRLNTLANAKNESRTAATQHYGSDYSQFSDEVNRKLQQQAQAQELAMQKYNSDYSQFANDRNFENMLSQQQYGQYMDQKNFAMNQQNQALKNMPQGPAQTKLDEILNSQSTQGVPDALKQIIMGQVGANRANPGAANIDLSDSIRRAAEQQGFNMDDPAMAPAWSMIYQMLNLK